MKRDKRKQKGTCKQFCLLFLFDVFPLLSGGLGGGFNSSGDRRVNAKKKMGDNTVNKPPAAKKPRTCGICHLPGHTRVTCPQR